MVILERTETNHHYTASKQQKTTTHKTKRSVETSSKILVTNVD